MVKICHNSLKKYFDLSLFSSLAACTFKIMVLHQQPLRTVWHPITTGNTILCCTKKTCSQFMIFVSFSIEKNYNPVLLPCPPLSHVTSCTPTKSNSYLANSVATVISESDLHRLLTVHVPNLMSLFHCLGRTKGSVQVWGTCICFVTRTIFRVRSC